MGEMHWSHHVPRDVNRIVEDQVHRWAKAQETAEQGVVRWPVVTVSRECGTNGGHFGRRLAHTLGFRCWDREIVTDIAEKLHAGETAIAQLDEHVRNAVEELLASALFGKTATIPDFRDQLDELVSVIAGVGSAVIVGRGAHCIVEPDQALRVRLVGPIKQRAASYADLTHLAADEAERAVRAGDKDRADFVRKAFHSDIADPATYDLTINVAAFPEDRAEALVLMAYLAKFGRLPSEVRGWATS